MKNKMDLIKMNSYLSQDVMKRTLSSSSNDANPKAISYLPNVPKHDEEKKGDNVELSDSKQKTNSIDEQIAKKLAKKLDEKGQQSTSDILKIVKENYPSVMKSIRAIIAKRAGLQNEEPKGASPELLASALNEAAGSPDPSRRVADVVTGVGLVPDALKDRFLEVAQKILGMENTAAKQAVDAGQASPIEIDSSTGNYKPSKVGLGVEVNFDLFFSISAKQMISQGENATGSFYDASEEMSSRFESNFSMEISGRFFSLADLAQEIGPKVLDSFSNAVKGLAGLDDKALAKFFDATEALFDEVEKSLGLSNNALDGIANEMKNTASSFFEAVSSASQNVFPELKLDQIFALPEELDSNGHTDLLTLLHDAASKRDATKNADGLLKALNSAENSKSLQNKINDQTPLEELMQELSA